MTKDQLNIFTFECITGCGEKVFLTIKKTTDGITFHSTTNGSQLTNVFCQTLNALTLPINSLQKFESLFWDSFPLQISGSRKESLNKCIKEIINNL